MARWPATEVVMRRTADLVPSASNARQHGKRQIEMIAKSIEEFGWTNAVLVTPSGDIVAGHGRVMAAQSMGLSEVPTIVADGWTDTQVRAYRIADNRLAETSMWDDLMLSDEMRAISGLDFDVSVIGFTDGEIAELCDQSEKLVEKKAEIKPKTMLRVLLSIPVDQAIEVKELIDAISSVAGVEVDFSGN